MNEYKKAKNAIKKANSIIRNDIYNIIKSECETEFDVALITKSLPIIFAIKDENKGVPSWCFIIDEYERNFDNVLAVGLAPEKDNTINDFFLLSVQDFTQTNFLIIDKDTPLYHSSKIEGIGIKKAVFQLIEQLKPIYNHLVELETISNMKKN